MICNDGSELWEGEASYTMSLISLGSLPDEAKAVTWSDLHREFKNAYSSEGHQDDKGIKQPTTTAITKRSALIVWYTFEYGLAFEDSLPGFANRCPATLASVLFQIRMHHALSPVCCFVFSACRRVGT